LPFVGTVSCVFGAAAAVVAKDAAIAAWAASMEPAETLPALSQSLHIGAVVKAIVYDTSKDSDGGAWRKRCADKSWYTETLGGDRWIGQHATIAAAWTAAGSTTGAVYQASATAGAQTSGLYYTPTSSTTVTQVYRGVTREFPAVAGIVAESARVVIYDLATGAMWMVFTGAATNMMRTAGSLSAITCLNGTLAVGSGGGANGLNQIHFPSDSGTATITTGRYQFKGTIANRNSGLDFAGPISGSTGIVNATVTDVAITVLDTAPIDPATGLPVPTIAVATAGGVSVIKDDGTVVNGAALVAYSHVLVSKAGDLWVDQGGSSSAARVSRNIATLTAGFTQTQYYGHDQVPPSAATSTGFTALTSSGSTTVRGSSVGIGGIK